MSSRVFIGLGSNVEDRANNIREAIRLLGESWLKIIKESSLYEGEPLEYSDQPDFMNAVIEAETDLGPKELLALCKKLEKRVGRLERFRYGPREIDIDLLIYEGVDVSGGINLPHPKMFERRFVIEPLLEIEPELEWPDGKRISDFLDRVEGQRLVKVEK